jgi:6,7-dimethyl-8-ribityllumazine synthase
MTRLWGRPPDEEGAEPDDLGFAERREVRVGEKIIPDETASENVRPVEDRQVGRGDENVEPAEDPESGADRADVVAPEPDGDAPNLATVADPGPVLEPQPEAEPGPEPAAAVEHAPGELRIPEGVGVFVGSANGARRSVGIAVSSFNGDITTRLLEGALEALEAAGVDRARVDVMRVPGAFELPLAAMALAKTRRYACVLALGCIIRGDTPHFEYIAAEAASGLQVATLETGVPVSFGVLTCDSRMQAEARAGGRQGNKGAEAARSGLEMADVFARLRADAAVAERR